MRDDLASRQSNDLRTNPTPDVRRRYPGKRWHLKRPRSLRKQRAWTQVHIAEHVGLDRSFISDLENGKKEVCIRNLEVLASAFEMTISQLLSRL